MPNIHEHQQRAGQRAELGAREQLAQRADLSAQPFVRRGNRRSRGTVLVQ